MSKVGLFLSAAVWEKTLLGRAMEEAAHQIGMSLVWLVRARWWKRSIVGPSPTCLDKKSTRS